MNKGRRIIKVFEHETLKIDPGKGFGRSHFAALEKYGYRTKEKYFKVGNERIKFTNYVGVIQVNDLTIEVLPKADNEGSDDETKNKWHNALIDMLHECRLVRLESISNANLKIRSSSILDIYFDAFLTETERIVRHGLHKSYRSTEENLGKVKGKILFTEHIRRNYVHKERFFVGHKVYDVNNKLNQILLKALLILSRTSRNPNHDIRIKRLILDFDDVWECKIDRSWFKNLNYGRNTDRYRMAVTLAKMIILNYSPSLEGGSENVLAILFDMNLLFEKYVYRKLKPLERDGSIPIDEITEQRSAPFWDNRYMRPDILIRSGNKKIVIDTKWKVLSSATPAMSDLRQMFAYNLNFDASLSILLYPKVSLSDQEKKPFRKEEFQNYFCKTAFVDLFDKNRRLNKDLGIDLYNQLLLDELTKT